MLMAGHKPKPTLGHYDRRGDEYRPAELGKPPPHVHLRTGVVYVEDPYNPERRTEATVNRRSDILLAERGRMIVVNGEKVRAISEGAFRVGRWLEGLFEER